MPKKRPVAAEFATILLDRPAPAIMRITLNRPEARNAQDPRMLYELNDAFDIAARDDSAKVVILAANGPHFSAGHDLRTPDPVGQAQEYEPVGTWCGFSCKGAEGKMAVEKEIYLGFCERWRNIPKITIAQVQGKVIAGGLMLIWPCDLIVAAEDAQFADNTVSFGVCGAEFFNHVWEVGARKAKEMLVTADFLSAQDAWRLGMVNHVVKRENLEKFTLEMADKIARKPSFVLKLAKEAVNNCQDAQGRVIGMQSSFALHQLSHAHNMDQHGLPVDPSGISSDKVRASSRFVSK
jgi:enoyl-CoA hydratase